MNVLFSFMTILIAVVSVACLAVRQKPPASTLVSPLLATEGWVGLNAYPGGISLRTAAAASSELLLKHNNAPFVYGYSPADRQLRRVNIDTWNNAAGEVVDCNRQVEKRISADSNGTQRKKQ